MEANKANFEKLLSKIGWKLKDHGCEHYYFYNYKNERTNWLIKYDERVECRENGEYEKPCAVFYFNKCFLQMIDKDTVCLTVKGTQKSVFILFPNYEKKEEK
jgi:hypothetical protein